jgi:acid phosphatase type 7
MAESTGQPRLPALAPARPAQTQVQKRQPFRSNQPFQPLPPPTGAFPFRLDLADVLPAADVDAIRTQGRLTLHTAGDTGGVKNPASQQIVALRMEDDFAGDTANRPAFFYNLGDVVYYNGERSKYYSQFYEPYALYPAPIFAIPGNHDGNPIDPVAEPSLTAFVENFCATHPHLTPEAEENDRDAMIQPNVYWTLTAPFLTIIGLYTNVPEGGRIDEDQLAWLEAELRGAPTDAALVVALHHPVYSADAHHGGSERMGEALDAAVAATGRWPDLVVTAHVHNYQRFTRPAEGRQVPYVVAGAGGYWHLHYMAKADDGSDLPKPWPVPDTDVTLEAYRDDRHGYLRLSAAAGELRGEYVSVPRPQESWRHGPLEVDDTFVVDLAAHTVTTVAAPQGGGDGG